MPLDPDSLERLVPGALDAADAAAQETLALHVERYAWAARAARPGRVLDCACGVGYGTRILLERNRALGPAVGVDVSPDAVAHANAHYADARTRFVACDALAFEDAGGFDTIVSLETIEHVESPERLLAKLVSLLRPGGVLIGSVPITPSVDLNPHHRHDFTTRSFLALGARHGLAVRDRFVQVQRLALASAWRGRRFTREKLRPNLPGYYLSHPGALARRVGATLRHGLANHYLTVAWRRSDA
ncbi:MAG: class I SAM-dependent methyltransferase [Proteobacteria bacterium]|nr:MAG: class I SAM-dependent methyltransferase [Pseudomonadota bacterium]